MVEDLHSSRALYESTGLTPSPIEKTHFHDGFTLDPPTGHVLTVNSLHVSREPV